MKEPIFYEEEENTMIQTLPHETWLHIFNYLFIKQQETFKQIIILIPLTRVSHWMNKLIHKHFNFKGILTHYNKIISTYMSLRSVNLVEWAIESGMCPWNEFSCGNKRKYLRVMEWLRKWNYDMGARFFTKAIEESRLDVLKWLKKNDFPNNKIIFALATGSGNLEVLEWLYAHEFVFSQIIYPKAAADGELSVLKWLKEKSIRWDYDTCDCAAMNGHLEVLKWLKENECPWDVSIASFAARGGQIHVLEWLKETETEENFVIDGYATCSSAARGGYIETLKWLRKNNFPWNSSAYYNAAEGGHVETLKWLKKNGCPWDDCLLNSKASVYAVIGGKLGALKWLNENGCPCDEATCYEAAKKSDTIILKYLFENGCPWPEKPVFRYLYPRVKDMLFETGKSFSVDESYVYLNIKTRHEIKLETVDFHYCKLLSVETIQRKLKLNKS